MSTNTPTPTPAPNLPIAWDDITSDPKWATLKPADRAQIARIYARKVLTPAYGGASHPAVADFLQKNVLDATTAPPTAGAGDSYLPDWAPDIAKQALNDAAPQAQNIAAQGFVGTAVNKMRGAPQVDGPGAIQGIKNAASDIYNGAATINPMTPFGFNPDFWHGAAGATGGVAGALPDVGAAVAGTVGGALALGGGPLGLAAAGALTNEAMAGGETAMRGGSWQDILGSMAPAGLLGLAPGLDAAPVIGKGGSLSDVAVRHLTDNLTPVDVPQYPRPFQPDPRLALPPGRPWVDGQYQYLPPNADAIAASAADSALPSPDLADKLPQTGPAFGPRAAVPGASAFTPAPAPRSPLPPNAASVVANVASEAIGDAPGFGPRAGVPVQSDYTPAPSPRNPLPPNAANYLAGQTDFLPAPEMADKFPQAAGGFNASTTDPIPTTPQDLALTPPTPAPNQAGGSSLGPRQMPGSSEPPGLVPAGTQGEDGHFYSEMSDNSDHGERVPDINGVYPDGGRSGLITAADNERRGNAARKHVLATGEDVYGAMHHDDVGPIHFEHGNEGHGVYGVLQKLALKGQDPQTVFPKLIETISRGEAGEPYHQGGFDRVNITHEGHRVVLQLTDDGMGGGGYFFNGFEETPMNFRSSTPERLATGDSGEFHPPFSGAATPDLRSPNLQFSRPGEGAEANPNVSQDATPSNPPPNNEPGASNPDTPSPGGRSGFIKAPIPEDIGTVARAGGRAALAASNAARRVSELVFKPVHALDEAWRDTSAFQKLADFREALKYGNQGGPLGEAMRKTFISNYGVDPKLLDIAETAAAKARNEVEPVRSQARDLGKKLNSNQQAALDLQVTEKTGAPRSDLAEGIGQESSRLSKLLTDVGALSKGAQGRWDGFYLPRAYEDKVPAISSFVRGADKVIRGEKARGTSQPMSEARFAELSKPWQEAGQTPDGKLVTVDDGAGHQVQVPRKQVGDYTGVWERLGTAPGGKVQAWRDYTLDERMRMGQERHVSASMMRLADKFESKYQTGRMLADISKDRDMAVPAKDVAEGDEPHGYTLLDKQKNRDGTYKWGALADHHVRNDVVNYLKWNQDLGQFKQFIKAGKSWSGQNLWKRFVTIHNPSYYLNNFMQNVPALEMSGGSIFDLPAAAHEIATDGPLYQSLKKLGAVDNGRTARDLALEMKALAISPGSENPLRTVGKFVDAFKALEAKGGNFSQATDDMFRVAMAMKHAREGMAPESIAKAIDGVFYDPSKVTSPAAEVASVAAPFAKGFFYTMDAYPKMAMENPAKALVLLGLAHLAKQLAANAAGYTTDKAKAGLEQLLPGYQKSFAGIPGVIPLPMHDQYGHGLNLDVHNWNPLQPVQGDDKSQLPIPGQLMPGGPLVTGAQYLANYDAFRQKPLREYSPDGIPIHDDSAEFLRNNLLPAALGMKGGKVLDALEGKSDAMGRKYDVPTALANMAGIKIQPFDNAQALGQLNGGYVKQMAELRQQGDQLARMSAANPSDAGTKRAFQANIVQQQALGAEWAKTVSGAANGFPSSPVRGFAAAGPPPVSPQLQQLLSRPGSGAGASF